MHDAPPLHRTAPESAAVAGSSRTLAGIAALLVAYAAAVAFGWPQYGRDLLVQAQAAHETGAHGEAHGPNAAAHGGVSTSPPPATVLPFAVLLAAIAILPLTPQLSHWWEHNSSKLLVAGCLALVTLGYYAFMHRHPVDLHFPTHGIVKPAAAGPSWGMAGAILTNAMLAEYVPFIVLLFALYCITGGVRIEGDLQATPTVNATFLGVGALAASFIGTTGAAMLLVRPLLETNRERRIVAHTVVFFILWSATAAAACCRSAIRRCSSAIWRASISSGLCRSGSLGSSPTACCWRSTGSGTRSTPTPKNAPATSSTTSARPAR